MSESLDRSLRTHTHLTPLGVRSVFSHSTRRLASVSILSALLMACSGETPSTNTGWDNPGTTPIPVHECDSNADCEAKVAESSLDLACMVVTCEESQCVYDGTSMNGATCDDGDACTLGETCNNRICVAPEVRECDDENACTLDTCNPDTGECQYDVEANKTCDDELSCTSDDVCQPTGVCAGTPTSNCECQDDDGCVTLAEEGALDIVPQDRCEGRLICQANYTCAFDTSQAVVCSDELSSDCSVGECVPETGACIATPINESGDCTATDDPCVDTGLCAGGACVGDEIDCDDGDPCTVDACDRDAGGCVHTITQGETCDDGDPCTQADACLADGSCVGSSVSCVDDNPCTDGSCEAETGDCVFLPIEGICNDENPCTVEDTCSEGVCVGEQMNCDDENPCTEDSCSIVQGIGYCTNGAIPDLSSCDLGEPCVEYYYCLSGACTEGPSLCECEVDDDCVAYNTDDPCSPDYFCELDVFPNVCEPDPTSVPQCGESDAPCILNECVSETGECELIEAPDGLTCDDDDSCSLDGFCFDGSCATTPVDCEDGNPCTANLCNEEGCYTVLLSESEKLLDNSFDTGFPDGWTAASDSEDVFWSPSTTYASGEGGLGMVVTGPGGSYVGPAEAWLISPTFHIYGEEVALRYKVRTGLAQSGCGTDVLQVGIRAYGIFTPLQLVCQTQTEWTDMVLDLTAYMNHKVQLAFRFLSNETQNAGFGAAIDMLEIDALFSCVDDEVCTTNEICQEGTCDLAPLACDDEDPCTTDACVPGQGCVHTEEDFCVCELATDCPQLGPCAVPSCVNGLCEGLFIEGACDTGDACATNGVCAEGVCVTEDITCEDDNPCTDNLCDSEVGCYYPPASGECNDEDVCTVNDQCTEGVCAGTPMDCSSDNVCALGTCVGGDCFMEPLHNGLILMGDDFDDLSSVELPPDWQQESSHPEWAWSPNTEGSHSAPNALAATGPIEWADEPVVLRLDTPEFTVPVAGATLTFMLSMAVGDESCDHDTLKVFIGDQELHAACTSTAAFEAVSVDLAQSNGPVSARFELTLAADTAAGVDVRLDDIEVLGTYLCATEEPCLDGVCVVGNCITEPVTDCE